MRRDVMRKRSRLLVPVVALAVASSVVQPAAAEPHVFPTSQALVPVAVAGAFVLPALVAALFAGLGRLARRPKALLGLGAVGIAGLVLAGYLNPELLAALRL